MPVGALGVACLNEGGREGGYLRNNKRRRSRRSRRRILRIPSNATSRTTRILVFTITSTTSRSFCTAIRLTSEEREKTSSA